MSERGGGCDVAAVQRESKVLVVREDECDSPMSHHDSLVVMVVDEGQGRQEKQTNES